MQILVRDGWTVAVTALYHARLPLHCLVGILQHGVGRHLCHVLPGGVVVGQQCGWRAEYRRRRTTGTAGTSFDANMDSLQQIYTPWIRSDGDARARGNNKEFRIQKELLTEAISRGLMEPGGRTSVAGGGHQGALRPRRLPEVEGTRAGRESDI